MAIQISRFAARQGATLFCHKCKAQIEKGDEYRRFKVGYRSRFVNIRCMRAGCAPRMSELTTSKMAGVYAALEGAEDALAALRASDPEDDASNIGEAVTGAAGAIEEVADEYREAGEASPTGLVFGEDLNERADEISDAASELESFSPSEDEADFDQCDNVAHDEDDDEPDFTPVERGNTDLCDDCREIKNSWWSDMLDEAEEALAAVRL